MLGTLRSLEARMNDSDPTGTCKKVVDAWLADIRLVIKDAEMPDYIAAFDAAYKAPITRSSSPAGGRRQDGKG